MIILTTTNKLRQQKSIENLHGEGELQELLSAFLTQFPNNLSSFRLFRMGNKAELLHFALRLTPFALFNDVGVKKGD